MWKHRLTEINPTYKTALCSTDGKVNIGIDRISKDGTQYYRCRVALNLTSRIGKYRRKHGIEGVPIGTKCEICGGKIRIAFDHDHKTGKHRGWLCMKCNTALGLVNDDPIILQKLIDYLKV